MGLGILESSLLIYRTVVFRSRVPQMRKIPSDSLESRERQLTYSTGYYRTKMGVLPVYQEDPSIEAKIAQWMGTIESKTIMNTAEAAYNLGTKPWSWIRAGKRFCTERCMAVEGKRNPESILAMVR